MEVPRNIRLVILQIICSIPDSAKEFKDELKKYVYGIRYVAPELSKNPEYWIEVNNILNKYMPNPDSLNVWEQEVVDIFTNNLLFFKECF